MDALMDALVKIGAHAARLMFIWLCIAGAAFGFGMAMWASDTGASPSPDRTFKMEPVAPAQPVAPVQPGQLPQPQTVFGPCVEAGTC